jgi:hypothetical protein
MSSHEVNEVYAFLAVDAEGAEGVPAAQLGDMLMPLVAADQARLDDLRPIARQLASAYGMKITVARFTRREDIETILP